ncbi:hypothetical protein BGO17_04360 [Candidatus Saccharibacteria bacterium 49-20]|nr:MAG: hypothetical protein BGO17_04360 [Candidatus Saccharibacteria bacterium 49-20]
MFIVAAVVAQLVHVIPTYAATLTWTGGGDGSSFSDGANWNTGNAPVNGDAVTFSVAGLSAQEVVDNDISGLTLVGITFTGAASGYYGYTLQGNPLTVSGAISNTISGANAADVTPTIQNNLVLNGNTTVNGVNLGVNGATINLQSYSLGVSGAQNCGVSVTSNLSGSGALNLTATGVNITGSNASYSGAIAVTSGRAFIGSGSFGSASAGTTVSGSGELYAVANASANIAEPFTFGGTGSFGVGQNYYGCMGGSGPRITLTATGGVTLNSNFTYNGSDNFTVNAPYTANGHTFAVAGGAQGSLTTPAGQVEAPTETVPLDGDSSTYVSVGNNQTAILNGTRDNIGVQDGGTLKGTGTANTIYVDPLGTIAPGNSPGTLTVLETLYLTGTYQAELLNKNTYDKLAVGADYTGGSNAVTLQTGATLSTVLFSGWSITNGDKFTIIDNQSSTAVSGTFEGLAEGAQFSVSGVTFSISYVGGDGNDVVLTALNTGSDPSTPNTGVHRFIAANPLLLAGLGVVSAGLLIAVAMRRKSNQ